MSGSRFIGRYKVIEELGRGGMGVVYRGEDPRLERPVAIKVLPPRKTSGKALERFKREARVCARLDHPYILKIYDYGEEDETYHIVMEYVEGITLRDVIAAQPNPDDIDVPEMARIFGQICQALEYAHAQGITHRDIKPENIMVTSTTGRWDAATSRIKVMDFGLAVLEGHHSLTEHGAVMGTIAYFSPEQAKGLPADHRSDIYSLGAVFYEMLTGELPFDATNPGEMIRRHLETPPPSPRIVNPHVSSTLERIVLRCMGKEPDSRYPSVREIRDALESYRGEANIPAQYFWGTGGFVSEAPDLRGRVGLMTEVDMMPAPPAAPRTDSVAVADMPNNESLAANAVSETPRGAGHASTKDQACGAMGVSDNEEARGNASFRERSSVVPQAADGLRARMQPSSGLAPVASRQWLEEAQESKKALTRYEQYMVRLQRDDVSTRAREEDVAPSLCGKCGLENPGRRKYCSECGSLLEQSSFLMALEAATHVELGLRHLHNDELSEARYEFEQALERDPNHADAHKHLGRTWKAMGDLVQAETSLRQAGTLNPQDADILVELAGLLRETGRKSDAVSVLCEAVRLRPSDAQIRVQLAFLHARLGNLAKAIEEYRTALAYDQKNLEAHLQLGVIYGAQNLINEAITEFEWVVHLDAENLMAWHWLGRLYTRYNRTSDAEKAFQTALVMAPDDANVHADLAVLYDAQRREDLALNELRRAIALDQGHSDARTRLAQLYLRHKQPAMAIKELEELAAYRPSDARVHQQLGELYLDQGDFNRALQHFEKTVSLDPASAEMHNRLGQLYLKKDYETLSVEENQKAVALDPYNPVYHEDLGMAHYVSGNRSAAIHEIKKASILDSRNVDYFKALGVLNVEEGRLEEAIQHLKRALELAPHDAQTHGLLGRVYAQQKLFNWALLEFQKALEYEPGNQLMHVYLARAFAELKRPDDAVAQFRKAISMMNGGAETPESRRALARSYQDLGKSYLETGNTQAARELVESSLMLLPADVRGMHLMGLVCAAQQMWTKALEYMSGALDREPHNPDILADIGQIYQKTGEPDRAINALRAALKRAPRKPSLYARIVGVLAEQGRYKEARQLVRKAMSLDRARSEHYHSLLGRLYTQEGQWQKAAGEYQQALAINGWNPTFYTGLAHALEQMGRYKEAAAELRKALSTLQLSETEASQLKEDLDRISSLY